ncbi:uncharacterized protein LOC117485744 isoform X3 [Trematomus bernacchii]|uniref:uncharacterized protein LOC117485744 isoform X3 n=1 Tax=Trematomus bernacchii TaxID=40690 RepID=UPI00146A92E5|nr:uncharacterized protein LOC117485744 isoform X3 [Trematomus bernacchii]
MNDQYSLNNIDSLLFQFALQTRELSQKKNEIEQQIKICRADTAERRSCIQTIHSEIQKLEEGIRVKQSTVIHNKANAKSMKATNSLLLQYEQSLKTELENGKDSYNRDIEVYEQRIASYRKIFQSHKEYYYQNPLAQILLGLRAEKEEIESRIMDSDDQITMKQKQLDHLTGPVIDSSSPEKLPDSVSDQHPIAQAEKQLDPQAEDESSSIDISSLHLNQTKSGHTTSVEANDEDFSEENEVQYTTTCSSSPEKENDELWSSHPLDEQIPQDEMHTEEQETGQEDQVLQTNVSDVGEGVEADVGKEDSSDEEQPPSDNEDLGAFHQTSTETHPQSSVAERTAVFSTPAFPFNFSPAACPQPGSTDAKSPAFLFSLHSDPSTPGFSGFGFDVGMSQEEDSSFAFTSPFFNEKVLHLYFYPTIFYTILLKLKYQTMCIFFQKTTETKSAPGKSQIKCLSFRDVYNLL